MSALTALYSLTWRPLLFHYSLLALQPQPLIIPSRLLLAFGLYPCPAVFLLFFSPSLNECEQHLSNHRATTKPKNLLCYLYINRKYDLYTLYDYEQTILNICCKCFYTYLYEQTCCLCLFHHWCSDQLIRQTVFYTSVWLLVYLGQCRQFFLWILCFRT